MSKTALGTWSGGKYMHFGKSLNDDEFIKLFQRAYENGIRNFLTSDVYGAGQADSMLGKALKGIKRSSYNLIGMIGHDFYNGKREGSAGYPRFTNDKLRSSEQYQDYLKMAAEKSLERCQSDYFDSIWLHNPDFIGYSSSEVWQAMKSLKENNYTNKLGIAPGPANGFMIDLIYCFENFGDLINQAMIILNPLEPWPGSLCLESAEKHNVDIFTRVVDYGGIFGGDVGENHKFTPQDHRVYRPEGWVERACKKVEYFKEIADKYNLTLLQFACLWNLSQKAVKCVAPTLIQEDKELNQNAKSIFDKLDELAGVEKIKDDFTFTKEEFLKIKEIGNNLGKMILKGASSRHNGNDAQADHWPMQDELNEIALKHNINPSW